MKAKQVCWAVMAIALSACSGGKSNLVSLDDMPVVTHQEVKDGPIHHLDMDEGKLRPVYWVNVGNKELQIHLSRRQDVSILFFDVVEGASGIVEADRRHGSVGRKTMDTTDF